MKARIKDDATMEFKIDPWFTGIMRGLPNDEESEGCVLKGTCIVHVHRPVKVRRLIVWFEGRSKVNLRGHSSIGIASTETCESRSLYLKDQHFIGDDGQIHQLTPGRYEYPFSFDIPANLPASFRGKYGRIRYRLQATMQRPMLSSDIRISQDIVLRRSLINDLTPGTEMMDTVNGENRAEHVQYSATATTMAYREGGLVRLNVDVNLGRPDTHAVRSVTCALKETVRYRTTGERSLTCQSCSKTEELFPLGWSTFYPSQSPDYSPYEPHNYNAIFRLCPRVNADTETRLLKVTHAIVVNIMIEEHAPTAEDAASVTSAEEHTSKEYIQQIENALALAAETSLSYSLPTPPSSEPSTPPPLSRTSSSSSLSSLFSSIRRSHHHDKSYSAPSSRRSSISLGTMTPRTKQQQHKTHLSLCSLELPVVVTSREHVWDGAMPSPPAYDTIETPPSYFHALEQLPAVPVYSSS